MVGVNDAISRTFDLSKNGFRFPRGPGPGVAKPERRQNVERSRFRPSVAEADLDQDILRSLLGVLHEHIKVAIAIEDAGVQQFIFHFVAVAPSVGFDQVIVGIGGLRIFVQILHIGVSRSAVEVEVVLFGVLAVVAFTVGQTEKAFLENRVPSIPQSQAKTEQLFLIAEAGQTILTPVIGSRTGLVVAEVVPGVSIAAIVLANRAPLSLTEIGTPLSPGYP